jgi:hypothetical protein
MAADFLRAISRPSVAASRDRRMKTDCEPLRGSHGPPCPKRSFVEEIIATAASQPLARTTEDDNAMKHPFVQLIAIGITVAGAAGISTPVRAQTSSEGPSGPAVYACVDTGGLLGATQVHWQTALPCDIPLGFSSSVSGEPSQTVFTAAFNADGTLAGKSALSSNAAYNSADGVYTITFNSAFGSTPACTAVLAGSGSSDFQIEISNVSATGATVAIQNDYSPFDAAASAFVLSCSNPP